MGYAVFAQRKVVLTSRLNSYQLQLMQMDDRQFALATDGTDLDMQLSSINQAQSTELSDLYKSLTNADNDDAKDDIRAQIEEVKNKYATWTEEINQENYELSQKENMIEMQKKRLETQITKISQELEAVEKAEQDGIQRANPKYSGLG
ncbi:hypothetical protein IJD44_05650 [bacterium]|nr:hypothetical protein [bacterium]